MNDFLEKMPDFFYPLLIFIIIRIDFTFVDFVEIIFYLIARRVIVHVRICYITTDLSKSLYQSRSHKCVLDAVYNSLLFY